MAENNKMTTVAQLKMLALRAQADSAARIADLAVLVAAGYGHLITLTLSAANWSGRAQKIKHESLLANSGYCYFVCGDADCFMDCRDTGIRGDNITVDGEITIRCELTPDIDLTVNILRLEADRVSENVNVGKVFNLIGGGGGDGPLKLENIAITKAPTKTTYKSGENFEPTGMVVTADYGYGIFSDVTGYTVTPSVLTDGVKEVTITYTEGRVTKTASTPVTVEKVLVSIEVTTPPTKTTYNYLEKFQPNGMAVTATFSDGSTSAATGYSYPTTEFSTLGQQPVNLDYTYEGVTKSTTLNVTVESVEVAVPTQKDTITYDGASKSPAWNGYDSVKMAVAGETIGVNAGDYTAKFR